jgi:predicted CxxxxCH...CXXCH cytochrome family protein
MTSRLATAVLVVALAGCGTARRLEQGNAACPTWKADVAQELSTKCASCHAGEAPAGGVDLSSYATTIQERERLARALDPATADEVHRPFTSLHGLVSTWTGECEVSYLRSSIHPPGILDPMSHGFHGQEIARQGWSLEMCADCHGADFAGGRAASACTTCHTEPGGPAACTTCHGSPPASGAHLAHATSPTLGVPTACTECHRVPETHMAPGHVRTASGAVDPPPAELTFGTLANAHGAQAGFAAETCSNVYCHGGNDVRWTGGPAAAACGTCHGTPPAAPHPPDPDCGRCHVAAGPAHHVNGVVDLGEPGLGCNGCHGSPTRPLSGAHRSHVEGLHGLAAPMGCNECHVVPETLTAPGHIDTPAPAEVTFGALARTRGATPQLTAAGCAGTYCHGRITVDWRPGLGQAACGTCHGVPPASAAHVGQTLTDCVTCHAATVDRFGNILVTGGTSAHINGRTDLVAQ